MPSKKLLSAIATTRDTNTSSTWYEATDLYVVAGMILDCYPAVKQDNDAVGEVALKEKKKEFAGTESLRAVECENVVRLGGEGCRRAGLFRLMLCRWAGRRGHMELPYDPARRYCAHLPLCQLNQQREFHLGVQWGPINLNLASN